MIKLVGNMQSKCQLHNTNEIFKWFVRVKRLRAFKFYYVVRITYRFRVIKRGKKKVESIKVEQVSDSYNNVHKSKRGAELVHLQCVVVSAVSHWNMGSDLHSEEMSRYRCLSNAMTV